MTPHWERNNTTITDRLKKLKSFHNGSYGADIDEAIKAIEALEEIEKFIQNSKQGFILDKLRAEIEDLQTDIHDNEYDAEKYDFVFEPIYEIIDRYKADRSDKE